MAVLINNNAASRLASSLSAVATALSVTPGEGAKFPSPTGGNWFPVTILKASGVFEIVRCTARSGDVLTIARSQEGTAAAAFDAGDRVELRITKAAFDELMQQSSFSAFIKTLIDDADAGAARATLGLGNAATQTIQASPEDTTAGRLMAVGAFGIGTQRTSTEVNMNNYVRPGKYVTPASGLTNLPAGWPQGSHVIDVSGGSGFALQVIADAGTAAKRIAFRTSVSTTFTAWVEIARTGNDAGVEIITANRTLTAADAGKYFFTSANSIVYTLPDPSTVPLGTKFRIAKGASTTGGTIVTAGGATIGNITDGGSGTSVDIAISSECILTAVSSTAFQMTVVSRETDFTIIYPNGGSAASPATIEVSSNYVENNPFPGCPVIVEAEINVGGYWVSLGWIFYQSGGGRGVRASHVIETDKIYVTTGVALVYAAAWNGHGAAFNVPATTSAPCRVKVWKVKGASV